MGGGGPIVRWRQESQVPVMVPELLQVDLQGVHDSGNLYAMFFIQCVTYSNPDEVDQALNYDLAGKDSSKDDKPRSSASHEKCWATSIPS